MDTLDNKLIDALREMARRGKTPSARLKTIAARLASGPGPLTTDDRFKLVDYFAAAFCFRDGQGQPIYGWFPDGSGELKDADIDRILGKRLSLTRGDWDKTLSPELRSA